jgi:uncharacterized protein
MKPDEEIDSQTDSKVETGRPGRVCYARIAPNQDLVHAVEALCLQLKLQRAFVRGSLGSLIDAALLTRPGGAPLHITGPAVEIASLAGEVRPDAAGVPRALIHGVVADAAGRVQGGQFLPGLNPVCMTFELTLEEWLPDAR